MLALPTRGLDLRSPKDEHIQHLPVFTEKQANCPTVIGLKEQPSFEDYMKRHDLLSKQSYMQKPLPPGFPARIESPSAWTRESFDLASLTYGLTSQEIEELEIATKSFDGELQLVRYKIVSQANMT